MLTLVLPGLLAQPAQRLSSTPALSSLATFAAPPIRTESGIEYALLSAVGFERSTPPAPLAALGAGIARRDDYLLHADPVFLLATRDDVVLTGRADDLGADEATLLRTMLDAHFASDGLAFEAPRADTWFARSVSAFDVALIPLAAACNRSLLPYLPQGNDGPRFRRWQDEIQMLLYESELNRRREDAGRLAISGIWFWGGGLLADCARIGIDVCAAEGRVGDLARGIAQNSGGRIAKLPSSYRSQASASHAPTLVVLPRIESEVDLESVEQGWLEPALAALGSGRLEKLWVLADGDGAAATFEAAQPSILGRIRARLKPRPFAVPAARAS